MDIFAEIRRLELPEDEYMVLGSGIMHALGIRESGDIDLLVSPSVFDELRTRGWRHKVVEMEGRPREKLTEGAVEAFKDFWYGDQWPDPGPFMREAQVVNGIPFLPLEKLLEVKRMWDRPKDIADVGLIEAYLAKRDGPTS